MTWLAEAVAADGDARTAAMLDAMPDDCQSEEERTWRRVYALAALAKCRESVARASFRGVLDTVTASIAADAASAAAAARDSYGDYTW